MDTVAIPSSERWALDHLFKEEAEFERAKREFVENQLPAVEGFRGKLLSGPAILADALETICTAGERLQLLHCYASLKSDEDTRDPGCQARRQEIEMLGTDYSQKISYLRPEILEAEPATLEQFLDSEPRLAAHAHFLRDLMRQRAHVLGAGEERILAETGLLRREAGSLYGLFTNAEMPRPEVTLSTGETLRLTPSLFQKHRTTRNREDRQALFSGYFSAYAAFRDTLGHNLFSLLKSHLFRTRVRRYDSCLSAALDPDHVPVGVYRNLIRQVHERLPTLHRYYELRRRCLGVERLEYPDLYCPLTETPPAQYSPDEARQLVCEGLEPLGTAYGRDLAGAFENRWIDWHATDGKRSGAYATGWAYGVHPYVLLNFNGDYDSVSTLAHEMGHAMHSFYSNRTQPFATADYSIFVAEVASTFNEALLLERMFDRAATDDEKLFLLGTYLDGIRGTLFRQTMFAEFELGVHERAERGEVMTGERCSEIYLRLLRKYHGHDEGVMYIADEFAVEWAAIPHMYYDFYVYQYATGIVAAGALSRAVRQGRPQAVERYLGFLGTGGSDYPLELLRAAGVDLEAEEPYADCFALIDDQLDQLERLI